MSTETQGARKPELGEGAAAAAPTAPHATPHDGAPRRRSGPERFWDLRRVRLMFAAALLASASVHVAFAPWSLFPEHGLELREVEGDLVFSIDTFEQEPEPPPPPAPPPAPETPEPASKEGIGTAKPDAGPKPKDAGRDARDAADDALVDAGRDGATPLAALLDAGEGPSDAGQSSDGAAVAFADAGLPPGAGGPRNPSDFIGGVGNVQPGIPNVQIFVNVAEVRKSAVGPQIGKFFGLIPEWDSFIAGTNVDPIRDTEWFYLFGPSLYTRRSGKLALFIRYSTSDAVVDRAVEVVSKKYASGGPFDAGVPGVRAHLAHADFAPRVLLRPQSRLLVVVPPEYANAFAKVLSKGNINKKGRPGEIARIAVRDPGRPMPFLPDTIKELRLWAMPREDGGMDIHGEAETPDEAAALAAAEPIKKLVSSHARNATYNLFTGGLVSRVLGKAEIAASGPVVRLHLPLSAADVRDIVEFAVSFTGAGTR